MDRGDVEVGVGALVVAHGEVGQGLRDRVDEETGRAGCERVFGRLWVVSCPVGDPGGWSVCA